MCRGKIREPEIRNLSLYPTELRGPGKAYQAWPEADYHVVPDAGHSAMEPGIRRALVAATERLKALE